MNAHGGGLLLLPEIRSRVAALTTGEQNFTVFRMAPTLPKPTVPTIPAAGGNVIYESVGKYARGAVLYAFERIGGAEALSAWAESNPDDFYTKLFPKVITREVEVSDKRGVDELLDALDGDYVVDEPESGTDASLQPAPPAAHDWPPARPPEFREFDHLPDEAEYDPDDFVEFDDP